MIKKNFLITGPPRSGKTTLLKSIISRLQSEGLIIGGVMCPEIIKGGKRWGFEIVDLLSNRRGILASIEVKSKYRVSKYGVNIKDLEEIGAKGIREAIKNADIIVIDEIGKMEFFSKLFQEAVIEALNSDKPVLGVIAYKYNHPLILEIKRRADTKLYVLSRDMGQALRRRILEAVLNNVRNYRRSRLL